MDTDLADAAFDEIAAVYGHIDENGGFVRKISDVLVQVLRTNAPKSRLCP
ncbi:hypothetical protein [Ligilactobacillus ruminis]|nr:hypothetical protein [Ligilactobacillus ruminis]